MDEGAKPTSWYEYRNDWSYVEAEVIEESTLTIYVNAIEVATIMCTPRDHAALALGFLKNEALIESLHEVEILHVSQPGCCVDIWLKRPFVKPSRVVITSGCGGGQTFNDPSLAIEPLKNSMSLSPERLVRLFNQLQDTDSLYARARGVHAAALSDGEQILLVCEDVGRHNTIDKLMGMSLLQDISTQGRVLLATGRISSEMLRKGALMGCPIVASRNSPTSLSVKMAQAWNVTLVGYVRRESMRVYTHPQRLGMTVEQAMPLAAD